MTDTGETGVLSNSVQSNNLLDADHAAGVIRSAVYTLEYFSLQQSCELCRGWGHNLSKVTHLVVGGAEIWPQLWWHRLYFETLPSTVPLTQYSKHLGKKLNSQKQYLALTELWSFLHHWKVRRRCPERADLPGTWNLTENSWPSSPASLKYRHGPEREWRGLARATLSPACQID